MFPSVRHRNGTCPRQHQNQYQFKQNTTSANSSVHSLRTTRPSATTFQDLKTAAPLLHHQIQPSIDEPQTLKQRYTRDTICLKLLSRRVLIAQHTMNGVHAYCQRIQGVPCRWHLSNIISFIWQSLHLPLQSQRDLKTPTSFLVEALLAHRSSVLAGITLVCRSPQGALKPPTRDFEMLSLI